MAGMYGEAIFSRARAGRGGAGNPPPPPPLPSQSAGRGGEGVIICRAGRGWVREHTACTD